MELNQFIAANLHEGVVWAATVELPRNVFLMMLELRDESERDGVEYGCNLYFRDGLLYWGDPIRGTKESTEMNTGVERVNHEYIGDFHTHPYRHRLDKEVSIGPSIGDVTEILGNRPKHLPIGVYFVFAGPVLHLIVLTHKTKKLKHVPSPDLNDRGTVMNYLSFQGVGFDHAFHDRPPDTISEEDPDYIQQLHKERRAGRTVPGYPRVFSNANLGVNQRAAVIYDYLYYTADLRSENNRHLLDVDEGMITCQRQRTPGQSPGTGLVCCRCGAIHSQKHSTVFGRWHQCQECQAVYCDWCGDRLRRPVYFTRERQCALEGCPGRTVLLS